MRTERSGKATAGTPGSARCGQAGHGAPVGQRGCGRPQLSPERLKQVRLRVERAIKDKKIFALQGPCPVIRRLLRARGWVERKERGAGRAGGPRQQEGGGGGEAAQGAVTHRGAQGTPESSCSSWLPDEEEEEEEEEEDEEDPEGIHDLMSRLVRDQVPYFIWTTRGSAVRGRLLQPEQVANHYARVGSFTTKEGLCLTLRNLPWFDQADPDAFFPRCYRLGAADERQAFIEDFRLTAARSLLKVALERAQDVHAGPDPSPNSAEAPEGPGARLVEEALRVCGQHLGSLTHRDIDGDPRPPGATDAAWDGFLRGYYRAVHEGAVPRLSGAQREQGRILLQRLAGRLPQLRMEGDRNIWILKPGAASRGRGITCAARLDEVLRLAGRAAREGRWVVQKYVERPLLVFGTKFDVRQWFLVTDWNPLTVWFYRRSYLRFCSRPFSLRRLDAAGHLCNQAVQRRCGPGGARHPRLPPDNTWSCRQLRAYLAQRGQAGAWGEVMVPGMKAAVVRALRCSQGLVRGRKGSFELYGADFVFGEDFRPWLLEINASPTMAGGTAVTGRLCAGVQRDTLRVVIDRRDDPGCSTGAFELIYKQAAVPTPRYVGLKLAVEGCSLRRPRRAPKPPGTTASTREPPGKPWSPSCPPLQPPSCSPAAGGAQDGAGAHRGAAGARAVSQLGHQHSQPSAALPLLGGRPGATVPILPPPRAPPSRQGRARLSPLPLLRAAQHQGEEKERGGSGGGRRGAVRYPPGPPPGSAPPPPAAPGGKTRL